MFPSPFPPRSFSRTFLTVSIYKESKIQLTNETLGYVKYEEMSISKEMPYKCIIHGINKIRVIQLHQMFEMFDIRAPDDRAEIVG